MQAMRQTLSAMILLALTASPGSAQTALQLRWELKEDVFRGRATRGPRALLHAHQSGHQAPGRPRLGHLLQRPARAPAGNACEGGVVIERVTGDLQRIVPGADFPGWRRPDRPVRVPHAACSPTSASPRRAPTSSSTRPRPGASPRRTTSRVPFERPPQPGRGSPRGDARGAVRARRSGPRHPPRGPASRLPDAAVASRSGRDELRLEAMPVDVGAAGAAGGGRPSPRSTCVPTSRSPRRRRARPPCVSRPARSTARLARGLRARRGSPARASASGATRRPASSTASSRLRSLLPVAASAAGPGVSRR